MQNCYFPVNAKPARAHGDVKDKGDAVVDPIKALLEKAVRLDELRSSSDEMRQAFMKLGVVSGASGSAYVEFNRTRVVCSVYGPRNDTRSRREFSNEGQLVCDFKYAPFADPVGRRERGQDPDELEMSSILTQALSPAVMLSKLPKCVVSIYVAVLESDGGELAAAINCASLALIDAAVEMYDIVTASGAGIVNSKVVLDPCHKEEVYGDGKLVLAFMPTMGKVTYMLQAGKIEHAQLQEAVDLCTDACSGVMKTMMTASLVQALPPSV
ncbi:Exosome complex exonuclease mtr3-like protein, partial [Globisporangium splendens]